MRTASPIAMATAPGRLVALRLADTADRAASGARSAAGSRREPTCTAGSRWSEGRIYDLLELLLANAQRRQSVPAGRAALDVARYLIRRLLQFNPVGTGAAQRGAPLRHRRRHLRPLPRSATGSIPAPISRTGADLEEAQLAKKRHLAAKLAIEPGQRVLDIGSGWGGLGLYLAKAADCEVTGVTLSRRAAQDLAASARRREGLSRAGAFRVQGLPQGRGPVRPHRLGRHVRARRRQPLRHLLPEGARAARPTTAWP